ncbi:MAG: biopolymer transporter ExbD [Oceanipulchritudo sp.]
MRQRRPMASPEIPIAPMIDCVFLMLVYFMTTSSLEKSEADLEAPFRAAGMASDPLPAVDEQELVLAHDNAVLWNGSRFPYDGRGFGGNAFPTRLKAFRESCAAAGTEAMIGIAPEPEAAHQALVSLLDTLHSSGLERIHFRH